MLIEPNKSYTFSVKSEDETEVFGKELGSLMKPGTLIALDGDLGMGKTVLTAAISQALGVRRDEVSSPTFTIMKQYYSGSVPVYHWDFYRVNSIDELYIADFFDLLSERSGLFIVEWASMFIDAWRDHTPRYEIEIVRGGEGYDSRDIKIVLKG